MTTQPTTTNEALEPSELAPCPFCPTTRRETYNTEGGIVGVIIHEAVCFFAAPERRQILTPRGVGKWNSRVTAPIVAPEVDYKTIIEAAIHELHCARTHEPKYCCPEDEGVYDRLLTRMLIEKLTAAAPASTVAPRQSDLDALRCECGDPFSAHQKPPAGTPWDICSFPCSKCECQEFIAPASPVAPISKDAWSTWFDRLGDKASAEVVNATADLVTDERLAALVQAGVLPSPVAIRDEAATCVKCGHDAGVDAIGTCLFGISNTDVKTWDCPCHCEFKPATAPPSTLAKAAELFPRSTYKDKRQLADKERFKLNAALNDYLFNNCDHEHDGYPNHLTCRWCALEIIAAIIERCLFAESEDQKSTPTGL